MTRFFFRYIYISGLIASALLACGTEVCIAQMAEGQLSPAQIQGVIDVTKRRLEENARQFKPIEQEVKELLNRVRNLKRIQQETYVSDKSIDDVMRLLHTQRVNLLIDLAGLDAKQKTIADIANRKAQDQDKTGHSETRRRIEELIAISTEQLMKTETLHKAGSASTSDVSEAKKAVINLEIQLLSLDEEKSQNAFAEEQLNQILLERAEKSARLAKIEELLNRVYKAEEIGDELVPIQDELNDLRDNYYKPYKMERQMLIQTLEGVKRQLNEAVEQLSDDSDETPKNNKQ